MRASDSRRLVLRVAAKLLGLVALAALAIVFLSSLLRSDGPRDSLTLEVAGLAPNEVMRVDWEGRRLLVLRRPAIAEQRLRGTADPALADPQSRHSEQPASMANGDRSAEAEFFVALDYDPDFGCPLDYVPPGGPAPYPGWTGGFHARCSDSWFDAAGRVFRDQRTLHNLRVPGHHFTDGRLVLEQ